MFKIDENEQKKCYKATSLFSISYLFCLTGVFCLTGAPFICRWFTMFISRGPLFLILQLTEL